MNPDYVMQTVSQLAYDLDEGLQKVPLGDISDLIPSVPPGSSPPNPAATNFQGLPDCTGVEKFHSLAEQMSAFGPAEHFALSS